MGRSGSGSASKRQCSCGLESASPRGASKGAEVVGLYLNPPLNALVISVDEKPSIQAIQRPSGYVETDSGAIVRAMKSAYKRNGTLNLG